jgi:hypothetical protein
MYTFDFGEGFAAWLGLNRAAKRHPLEVNPVVGIDHEPTRQIENRLMSRPENSVAAVLSEPLRYLTSPPTPLLVVRHPDDAVGAVRSLVMTLETDGLPFARSLASPEALVGALQKRRHLAVREYALTRLPAALLAFGRGDEALEAAMASEHEVADRQDPAAEMVREFAAAVRASVTK